MPRPRYSGRTYNPESHGESDRQRTTTSRHVWSDVSMSCSTRLTEPTGSSPTSATNIVGIRSRETQRRRFAVHASSEAPGRDTPHRSQCHFPIVVTASG